MIRITNELLIPENEITFTASRSGGPGGQNVNKVSSRVTLSFDVSASTALSEEQKQKVARKLATRMNKAGVLRIVSQRTRSQEMNRADALERFVDLLSRALTPQRRRVKTRMPAAAKERRMEEKKKRTHVKQTRSKKGWDS
jgi:ribosome-associated protein